MTGEFDQRLDDRLVAVRREELLRRTVEDMAAAHVPVEEIELWLEKIIEAEVEPL